MDLQVPAIDSFTAKKAVTVNKYALQKLSRSLKQCPRLTFCSGFLYIQSAGGLPLTLNIEVSPTFTKDTLLLLPWDTGPTVAFGEGCANQSMMSLW